MEHIEKLFILTEEKTNRILDKEKEKTGLGIITRAKAKELSSSSS